MSQLAFRQQIASDMFDGLVDAGMADAGTYTPPGAGQTAVPCRVVINRGMAPQGNYGAVSADKTTLRLLVQEVPSAVRDAVVAADGDTFKLVKELSNDGAVAMWDVL